MRYLKPALLVSAALFATQASAQNAFDGFRADVGVAGDRFYSEGNNNNEIGVGASAGFDFALGDNAVVGPEVSFLWAPSENITRDGAGIARRKSFEEYGAGLRIGAAVAPTTLVYGKLMYVVNEQRKLFTADTPRFSYRNEYRTQGFQVGAGLEQAISDNLYVKAEGRYSNYRTNSSRITGLLGVGLRFGGT